MHILVTNDDGVTAPGLQLLAKAVRPFGKITILAPNHNWSASGHVKTLHKPLRVNEVTLSDGTKALSSDGAPSDCVALATMGIVPGKIDLVVSGINSGPNLGHDVTYSGTVTAAMEAVIAGIPGIAFSFGGTEQNEAHYETAVYTITQIMQTVLKQELDPTMLLNVNIPLLPKDKLKGIRITRQGTRVYLHELVERVDPRKRPYYWIGGDAPSGIPDEGTDIGALSRGYVSITPLHLDLTAYQMAQKISAWKWE